LIFSPNHRDVPPLAFRKLADCCAGPPLTNSPIVLPLAFANSPIAASVSQIFAFESRSNGETNALSRIFSGDFHTPQKKSAFFQPFLRFLLAFRASLGYSPLRPEFFR
jgi:hypothetical protein